MFFECICIAGRELTASHALSHTWPCMCFNFQEAFIPSSAPLQACHAQASNDAQQVQSGTRWQAVAALLPLAGTVLLVRGAPIRPTTFPTGQPSSTVPLSTRCTLLRSPFSCSHHHGCQPPCSLLRSLCLLGRQPPPRDGSGMADLRSALAGSDCAG
jgi:hypothetical protein